MMISEIARTIHQQIPKMTLLELGARDFVAGEKTLSFRTRNMGGLKIVIEYDDGMDLYNVYAGRFEGGTWRELERDDGVYWDQLNEILYAYSDKYLKL